MQPGIAFPRALQGETLDFSEPQPNRCWFLESHQKQAFMLLSFFFALPHSLSLTFMHLVFSFWIMPLVLTFPCFLCFFDASRCLIRCPVCEGQHLSVLICVVRAIRRLASKVSSAVLYNPFFRCI